MKKLSLDKLLIGSLTEAQQKEVLGGAGATATPLMAAPFTSIAYSCTYAPTPPPNKTTSTTPCA